MVLESTNLFDYNRAMKFDSSPFIENYLSTFSRLNAESNVIHNLQLPSRIDVREMMEEFTVLLFPDYEEITSKGMLTAAVSRHMDRASNILFLEALLAYRTTLIDEKKAEEKAERITSSLLEELPHIREMLKKDGRAGYEGDPAANSVREIILTYPGFKAILAHRIAHYLFSQGLPLIPRMINELIHSDTGIDIHPGATIGEYFFIDHGTGVVIGETSIIGDNVKIYQGVTLGALSFPKDGCGMLLRGAKRHPSIEGNVTIYANATLLGDITIGHDSTIGSNTWIKENIAPYSLVTAQDTKNTVRSRKQEEGKQK